MSRRALAGVLAAACAFGLAWAALSDGQRITHVSVAGARHVAVAAAVEASRVEGAPVFWASGAEARDGLRGLAAVRDARVEIILPDTARITLVERVAVGRWVAADGLEWYVDGDGVLFPSADPGGAPQLRVTDQRGPRHAGERVDPALVAAGMRLAAIASGELRVDATQPAVVMTGGANGLVLRFGAGWEIRFGGPERFDEKLAVARRFLKDEPQRHLDYVDVRSPDRIVYSPQ